MKIMYPELIRQIGSGLVRPDNLWVRDSNDIEWFWRDGGFMTGMRNGDTEAPLIYITDKYNIVDLYSLELTVLDKGNYIKVRYTMEDIINKYSSCKDVVYFTNIEDNSQWEFIPLNKSIISTETGESIFDFLNEDEVSMAKFEILWKEKSLPKEEIKSITLDNALEQIKELKETLNKLETTILSLKNIKEA